MIYCLGYGAGLSLPQRSDRMDATSNRASRVGFEVRSSVIHPQNLQKREPTCEEDDAPDDDAPADEAPYQASGEEPEHPDNEEDYENNKPDSAGVSARGKFLLRAIKTAVTSKFYFFYCFFLNMLLIVKQISIMSMLGMILGHCGRD